MRIALLGSGRLALQRAAALLADPRVDWLGIGSGRTDWGPAAARALGASTGDSVAAILAQAPDAVLIASATTDHAEQIRECLGLGVPIFCEKPIALDLADATALVADIDRAGVPFQVGFDRRFDPGLTDLRRAIRDGETGELQSITLTSHDRDPPGEAFAAACGGMFLDLHVHDFDLARWLSGEEVRDVVTIGARRGSATFLDDLGDVDTTAILLRMASGLPVVIRGAREDPAGYLMRAEVVGTRRSITVGDVRYADYRERFAAALAAETVAFLDLVAGTGPNHCPGRECVVAIHVALAAERSLRLGQVVHCT